MSTAAESELKEQMTQFLARLTERDRGAIEKHLAACDAEGDGAHGDLWRRLVVMLASQASAPPRRRGTADLQFFIPDGRYRKQVFALEDHGNGVIILYLPDVLDMAVKEKLLHQEGAHLSLKGVKDPNAITLMTAANSPNPGEHVEHMLGWNRKALRLVLSVASTTPKDLKNVEALCKLAAKAWPQGTA